MTPVKESAKIGLVPNQPKTPARAVRIDDETWEAVRAEAESRSLPGGASEIVREALANRAAVARVRELHKRGDEGSYDDHCEACECWWPCPTVEALEGVWQPDED